jgi:hypothetical protein
MNARYAQLAARVAAALHKARPRPAKQWRIVADNPAEAKAFTAAVDAGVLPPAIIREIVHIIDPEPQARAPAPLPDPGADPEPPTVEAAGPVVPTRPAGPLAYCANCGGEMPETDARPHLHEDCARMWNLATAWRNEPPRQPWHRRRR